MSLIRIENGKGEVINFNVVVPTAKGAIYACEFVLETEVVTACNDTTAHCLLGHRNKDSTRMTAKKWVWC